MRLFWQACALICLALVLGAGGFLFYLDRSFAGLIYPNISIRGLAVGQMNVTSATDLLNAQYAPFLSQPLTLTYGDRTWTPTMAELGVQVQIDEATERAFTAGRSHGFIENLREVAAIWQSGLEVPLHVTVDQGVMQRYLTGLAADLDRPATDAQLSVQPTLLETTPAITGRQVLVNETIQDITAALQELAPQTVALRTGEIAPLLNDADVAQARESVATLLQGPLTLQAEKKSWEWSVDDLARMVQVRREPRPDASGDQLLVDIDRVQLAARLKEIADQSGRKPQHPRVNWNDGKLSIFRQGVEGRQVDVARAEQLILDALRTPNRTVALPFTTTQPQVTEANLAQLGIDKLLAVGQSDFTGSAAYRITNIKAGMNLLHGILLAPGEEFSFNNTVGRIDASNGFVEGYAIIQNRTQLEYGGGICQDSTTMFRAAFWAGLPITERWGHSFYINWYDKYGYGSYGNGPGMDATIFTGGPDFKFVNDTGHWLLIQTVVNAPQALAEVRIYGTDTGRKVELQGPEITNRRGAPSRPVYVPDAKIPRGSMRQSDRARGGMDITFTRIIKQNGTEVNRETFLTRFKPWPNIFEVNPADLGPDGTFMPKPREEQPADGTAQPTTAPGDGSTPPAQPTPVPAPGDSGAAPPPAQPTPAPPEDGSNPPQPPQPPPSEG